MNLSLVPAFGFTSMFGRMAEPVVEAPAIPSVVRTLRAGETWSVQHPRGCRIECLEGQLRVHQDAEGGDFAMSAGGRHDVAHDRIVTMVALSPACVRLTARRPA